LIAAIEEKKSVFLRVAGTATPEEQAWVEADRRLREKLTVRDIGIWTGYRHLELTSAMMVNMHDIESGKIGATTEVFEAD
jgi:hypothetical protein